MASITAKNGRFHVRVRIKNSPTACASFLRRADAIAWSKTTEADVLAGRYKRPSAAPAIETVGDLLTSYAAVVVPSHKGAATESNVLTLIKREATALCARRIVDVKPVDVSLARDAWINAGKAAATVRNRLAILSCAFTYASQELAYEGANPVKGLRRPRAPNARQRRLADGELSRIINVTQSDQLPSLLVILAETALRRSEAIGLRWSDVDLQAHCVTLRDEKNGEQGREVPLSPRACAELTAMLRRKDGRVFDLTPNAASHSFLRAVRRARELYEDECRCLGKDIDQTYLNNLRIHDLRRSAISTFAESGLFNVLEVAQISGHKTLNVLHQRYSRLRTSRLVDKLAAMPGQPSLPLAV